jgi:hypothetical protein
MNKVKIEEIANELGIKSRELIARIDKLSPEAFFSLNIKSAKSMVSVKVAEEIFDAVMNNREFVGVNQVPIHHNIGQVSLSFVESPLDIEFIKRVASIYKIKSTEHFMVRSFNFSEMDIVRFFTAGLIGMDVARYINNRSSKEELNRLVENLNVILDDVEVENIDDHDPLDKLEAYIAKYNPEVIYIEGIKCNDSGKYVKIFQSIYEVSKLSKLRFEMSFINLPVNYTDETIDRIVSYFRN